MDKFNNPHTCHIITYTDKTTGETNRTCRVMSTTPAFNMISQYAEGLVPGKIVDLKFVKNDAGFWNLDTIGKEGQYNTPQSRGNSGGGGFKSNPARDLSMKISGILQAVITHYGLSESTEQLTLEALALKDRIQAKLTPKPTASTTPQPIATTATTAYNNEMAAVSEQKTQAGASFNLDNMDSPF